jgi:hypothetical protein
MLIARRGGLCSEATCSRVIVGPVAFKTTSAELSHEFGKVSGLQLHAANIGRCVGAEKVADCDGWIDQRVNLRPSARTPGAFEAS